MPKDDRFVMLRRCKFVRNLDEALREIEELAHYEDAYETESTVVAIRAKLKTLNKEFKCKKPVMKHY